MSIPFDAASLLVVFQWSPDEVERSVQDSVFP